MAYREHGMWEVLEVLRRIHRGESRSRIERATGRSRKTIGRYVRAAKALGWIPKWDEPDEDLASRVLERLRPGRKGTASDDVAKALWANHTRIVSWLKGEPGERGLQLTKIHQLLTRDGVKVSYSSLYRYVVENCGFRRKVTVRRAEARPGEVAEVDFGRLGRVFDPQRQRNRMVWALIVTLLYSRHQYFHVTHSQKLPDLIDGLEDAWDFFQGCPERLVIDNMKAAVTKPNRYDPFFQRTFEEYARHRGLVIDAAVSGHATGKPVVERAVPYVRENFFRGEQWLDLAQVQREAPRWCLEVAGMRLHGTTRKQPLVVFEQEEKQALRPLQGERFDTPQWAECKVHPDHHIRFLQALYSVPTRYLGKEVSVRGDRSLVRIYCRGQLIKTHPAKPPGELQTDYEDYPSELEPYARRDPDRMINQARKVGAETGRFMERLLEGPFPWCKLRQAQKLMRLVAKHGNKTVEAACRRALAFDLVNVKRVERMILKGWTNAHHKKEASAHEGELVPMPARFLRPKDSFTDDHSRKEEQDGSQTVPENRTEETQALGNPRDLAGEDCLCQEDETSRGGVSGTRAPRRD
jgi:transposase